MCGKDGSGGWPMPLSPSARRARVEVWARDCDWLYVVTRCDTAPRLEEPVRDPARLTWHEVTKVAHDYLSVDAMTRTMRVQESPPPDGGSG